MPNTKKQKNEDDDVTINLKESSVAEFTKRPVPTNKEVEEFELISFEELEEIRRIWVTEKHEFEDILQNK